MADTVSTLTLLNGPTRLNQKYLNKSDATGETAVTKVTLSNYTVTGSPAGNPSVVPTSMLIEKIEYDIQGMKVQIIAAGTTPIVLATLGGFGNLDYRQTSGLNSANTGTGAGNIQFTTIGATSGSTYDITLYMRKQGG